MVCQQFPQTRPFTLKTLKEDTQISYIDDICVSSFIVRQLGDHSPDLIVPIQRHPVLDHSRAVHAAARYLVAAHVHIDRLDKIQRRSTKLIPRHRYEERRMWTDNTRNAKIKGGSNRSV